MVQIREETKLVLVHHRKSGKVEVRDSNDFSRRPRTPRTPLLPHLHYRNGDRSHVCRCSASRKHKQSSPVASHSTHLEADMTRYLDRHNVNECSVDEFYAYRRKQKDDWANAGVHTNLFHYATAQKDVVCRCTKPNNHGKGWVRNTKIIEMCAEFFCRNKGKMTCTKTQWRSAGTASLENNAPWKTSRPDKDATKYINVERNISPKSESFKYDSVSTVELLRARANGAVPAPRPLQNSDVKHLSGGSSGVLDIPEEVWIKARPSVWADGRVSETSNSTPLGIATAPHFPVAEPSRNPSIPRSGRIGDVHRVSDAIDWSKVQRDAEGGTYKIPTASSVYSLTPTRTSNFADTFGVSILKESAGAELSGHARPRRSSSIYSDDLEVSPGMVSSYTSTGSGEEQLLPKVYELPSQHALTELPTTQCRPKLRGGSTPTRESHPFDLQELEENRPKAYSEWPGKQSDINIEPSLLSQESMKISSRLSSIFREAENIVGLPDQDEFLLRHVVVCSHSNSPPLGDCSVCKRPYNDRRMRAIRLPSCGHFLHEECLVANFRIRDEPIGRCPICDLALCVRDLADCMETDRKAIFSSQHTERNDEVRMEFQSRGQTASLQSEEEVAAAQLRLLKDYIDVHADECWHQWQAHPSVEPNWYGEVIQPVIRLFKGWNLPSQQSRYFSDRDAFLKFIAWAELVRLMNVTQAVVSKVQGSHTPFPPLAELHCEFLWSKDRYEKEKTTWKTSYCGVLECDKVAQDAYSLAMSTRSSLN